MGFRYSVAVAICAISLFCTSARAENRVALVIGNGAYQNVARLDNPTNDAKLMAETLSGLGFKLVGGGAQINLDKASMDNAIASFGSQVVGANVALFYYAGHGVQVRGSNYMVPVGANPAKEADVHFQMVDVAARAAPNGRIGDKAQPRNTGCLSQQPFGGRGLRSAGGGLAKRERRKGQ